MRTLKTFLFEHYHRFNVFQLMRLLLWKTDIDGVPPLELQGEIVKHAPHVRFAADLSAAFPGQEFSSLSVTESVAGNVGQVGMQIKISTPNYCIAGTLGPLPEPFTEWLRDQAHRREYAMHDFLNIFNQRLNMLRFQLKHDMLPALNSDAPQETVHAYYLASLIGMGSPTLARQVDIPERAWLALAGMLSNCRRSAANITHLFSLLFSSTVTLEQWVGAWQPIEPEDRNGLGMRNHQLGRRSVLGRKVWDQQARVRITIPDVAYTRAGLLLPPEPHSTAAVPGFAHMRSLIHLLLDRQFDCEVCLQLPAATLPPAKMIGKPDRRHYWGLRLGQTAWLGTRTTARRQPHIAFLIPAFERQGAS